MVRQDTLPVRVDVGRKFPLFKVTCLRCRKEVRRGVQRCTLHHLPLRWGFLPTSTTFYLCQFCWITTPHTHKHIVGLAQEEGLIARRRRTSHGYRRV